MVHSDFFNDGFMMVYSTNDLGVSINWGYPSGLIWLDGLFMFISWTIRSSEHHGWMTTRASPMAQETSIRVPQHESPRFLGIDHHGEQKIVVESAKKLGFHGNIWEEPTNLASSMGLYDEKTCVSVTKNRVLGQMGT